MTARHRNVSAVHRRLYQQVPHFECRPGCTDCCGPVPFSRWEWAQVQDQRSATDEDEELLRCPYSRQGRCDIYGQRPLMCRLFGTVDDLRCPHGCRPARLLTDIEAAEMLDEYKALMK